MASLTASPLRALVIGGRGGIGGALTQVIGKHAGASSVLSTSRDSSWVSENSDSRMLLDPTCEKSWKSFTKTLEEKGFAPHLVVVSTGVLHDKAAKMRPEAATKKITVENLTRNFTANTVAPAISFASILGSKKLSKELQVVAALSARVGSISCNESGGWHSYRMCKAATNMLVKTAAIEMKGSLPNAAAVSIHPGTVETGLSQPFVKGEKKEGILTELDGAREALKAELEVSGETEFKQRYFSADVAANLIWENVLSKVGAEDTGLLLDYAGRRIPF